MQTITQHWLEEQAWFNFLSDKQQKLARLSISLIEREEAQSTNYVDYSYVVFPLAKVYEGFLKKYFLELQLISKEEYQDKRFRIGRALNPDVNARHQDEHWLYDDVTRVCGIEVAKLLWETWLKSRNRVFHYFPEADDYLSLVEAESHLTQLSHAMQQAISCSQEEKKQLQLQATATLGMT